MLQTLRASGQRAKSPEIVASRQEAVEKMYSAGLKHLHRPNSPGDPYYTAEAVRAWAEVKADEYLASGVIVIGALA